MAKLYFNYSSMNAGKTTMLLQSSYNYRERGMNTVLFSPRIDDRYGVGKVTSRIGLESEAHAFTERDDLFETMQVMVEDRDIHCVLVDEAQFLTKAQVFQLGEIADRMNIPVMAYGLRTDFRGELFDGSTYLLAWADIIRELKTICSCGKKATMVVRVDESGQAIREGSQVQIGGNDRYVSVCRLHFKDMLSI